jgi:Flp pilus assembly protein TadG
LHTSSPEQTRAGHRPGLPGRRRLRGESGAAIVEFALILPFVCLVVVMILDFGRAFNYWIDTTHLASEGARLAAVDSNGPGGGTLQAYIRSKADTPELENGGTRWIDEPLRVCVTPDLGDKVGDPVEVTVTTTYKWLPMLDVAATEISGTATMRREVAPENVDTGCG